MRSNQNPSISTNRSVGTKLGMPRMPLSRMPMEWLDAGSWRLPSGKALAEFALQAGFLAPLLWSGLLYTTLGVVNPLLDQRIDWLWFIASQFAFGLVAGFVVNLHVRVRTAQFQSLPFAVRAGFETQGPENDRADGSK